MLASVASHPTPGLYPCRNVEGFSLLLALPGLETRKGLLQPKELFQGWYKAQMETLRKDLQDHQGWLLKYTPRCENALQYIRQVKYDSPLNVFMVQGSNFVPTWSPSVPQTSFSIFPPYIVMAMPSIQCQYDRDGVFPVYREMGRIDDDDDSVMTAQDLRYTLH